MSGRRSRGRTPAPLFRTSSRRKCPTRRRCLVEHTPNQPYLVAPGKHTVQKLPDFKMTSSQPSTLVGANRTLADRRLLHHQPRRQDRSRDGRGRSQPRRPHRTRRMRALSALWRDPGSDAGRPGGDAGTAAARARPAGPAGRDARRAPPATRWIARCWTSRPRPAASASGTCSDAPRRRPASPPIRSRSASPEAMAAATAKAAHRPLLKIKLGGDGDGARIAAVRKAAPEFRTHRRRQRGLDAGQSRAKPGGLRASRRHPGGTAAAGRPGRGARRTSAGRSPSAPTKACMTAPRWTGCANATMPSTSSSTRPAA